MDYKKIFGILAIAGLMFWAGISYYSVDSTQTPVEEQSEAPEEPVIVPAVAIAPFSSDRLTLEEIGAGSKIKLPLLIKGEAKNFYFEASFPVKLLDNSNNVLGTWVAQAQSDWMTSNFVPFQVNIVLANPYVGPATLVFMKDNPSGEPANDFSVSVPVVVQ